MNKPKPQARGKELSLYKEKLSLSAHQKEMLFGLILGDVSLQTQDNRKTYRVKFEQSDSHKEYIEHLHTEFNEWCLSEPRYVCRKNSNNNTVITWAFQTLSHSEFTFFGNLFYDINRKKRVLTNLITNYLTDVGLSYWFMDDGSKMDFSLNQGKGIHLHTQNFTISEVDLLCSELKTKFSLECWRGENKKRPIIIISGKCFSLFMSLVGPHILPSMKYKLPSQRIKNTYKVDDIV